MADTKKAEEEISTIFSLFTIGGLILPGLGIFLLGKLNTIAVWALNKGLLEKSDRVMLEINNGIGLDLGRILITIGISLLVALALGQLIKAMWKLSKPSQNRT